MASSASSISAQVQRPLNPALRQPLLPPSLAFEIGRRQPPEERHPTAVSSTDQQRLVADGGRFSQYRADGEDSRAAVRCPLTKMPSSNGVTLSLKVFAASSDADP
jgi:hypothetical protein